VEFKKPLKLSKALPFPEIPAESSKIIRYLDLASYYYLNHPDRVQEFYFVLIIDTEKPPMRKIQNPV
jgi:hypothetical protein